MPSVSHSEVDGYLLCRRKHYYGYGLSLQRVSTSNALAVGSLGHKVLQAYYDVVLEAGDTWREQKNALPQALVAARKFFDAAKSNGEVPEMPNSKLELEQMLFDFYFPNEPLVTQGWIIQGVEWEGNLEYDPETKASLPFVIDIIALDPKGKTVIVDHKFAYDFYSDTDTELMPQISKYIGALRALNYQVAYGMFNIIRTRKQKTMTVETQLRQVPTHPTGTQVQRVFLEQIDAAAEVQALKSLSLEEQDRKAFRTANKMVCQHCSFRDLCVSELTGGNSKLMMETEFSVRERKSFDTVSEEAE